MSRLQTARRKQSRFEYRVVKDEHVDKFLERQADELVAKHDGTDRLAGYRPYPKQCEFHAAGNAARERLLMAGNQLGKTLAGGFEAAMHATGRYPAWWKGRRFDRPTVAWVGGVTGESTRDSPQRVLLGRPGAHGTGAIPKDALGQVTSARGVADLADNIEYSTYPAASRALRSSRMSRGARNGRARRSTGCGSTRSHRSPSIPKD